MISEKTTRFERKYQRYDVDNNGGTLDQIKVIVAGEPVRLVNYSLGGLYFLSKQRFMQTPRHTYQSPLEIEGK
jgi:hypothetical protein